MNTQFQLATEKDLPRLLELMREFYQEQEMVFDEEVARSGLRKTLLDPGLGSAYLILAEQELAGYFAITFCYSLEFHGKFALVDEIYLRTPFRRKNLGSSAMKFAEEICKKTGIKAMRLEVGETNKAAQSLYEAVGFKRDARYLFTKWI